MSAKVVIALLVTVMTVVVVGMRIDNETAGSCSDVRRAFVMKGIGPSQMVPDSRTKGEDLTLCPSSETCCSKPMEDSYQEQVKKDFRNMLQSSGSYLKTLITTSATKFKDTFLDMVQVSENSTTALFSDVHQLVESTAREPLGQLFADLLAFVSGQDVDLEDRVHAFFDSLFPLAFHHSVHNSKQKREFTESYKECLRQVQQEVRPFGDLPDTIVLQVARSFEAARTFLEALQVGVEVLNTTEHMDFGPDCRAALVKLNYCPHCQGILEIRPCNGLCMNVIRGCLSSVSELDSAWSEYVSALERLTSGMVGVYNIEQVLSTLDTKISETIMYVMENTPEITKRVKQKCGHLRRVTREVPPATTPASPPKPPVHPRAIGSDTSLYIQLQNFVHKVAESKDFYSELADNLCKDGNMGIQGDHRCWNGEAIGDYSKAIAGVGVSAQKYNPEMRPPRVRDVTVTTLVEKLQHVRQVLTSRVTSCPSRIRLLFRKEVVVVGNGDRGQTTKIMRTDLAAVIMESKKIKQIGISSLAIRVIKIKIQVPDIIPDLAFSWFFYHSFLRSCFSSAHRCTDSRRCFPDHTFSGKPPVHTQERHHHHIFLESQNLWSSSDPATTIFLMSSGFFLGMNRHYHIFPTSP